MVKRVFRGAYVFVSALWDTVTVSFMQNVKKRNEGTHNKYMEVKVPRGYPEKKAEPDYKDLTATSDPIIPGFKF
jgi:hypothetical protein